MSASNPRVGLVFGGDSAEREISLKTGRAVAEALERRGIGFREYDGPAAVVDAARAGVVDVVLNMLHGRGGEDGRLQGALSLYGVPVTGSGVLASALTMDKLQTKRIWRATGVPTPEWRIATQPEDAPAIADSLGMPVFVKPAREGSSVGMTRVESSDALPEAIERASAHDAQVLVECLIDGPEYTAAILAGRALPLIRIETPRAFYDFDAKYAAEDTRYHCPCGLDAERETELAALAGRAFDELGCRGWGRVDFLVDESGAPWMLEVNTVPGMTDHSLVPMAAAAADIDFDELVVRILATAEGVT
ncbi:MAG: D-alanine--D-alanine ligase [Candidatus Wenzhouxiangella sp. M2_3B_020]